MIGGIFTNDRISEKISNFYLPNKEEFDKSMGLDYTNRLSKKKTFNDEIVILAQFCEIVGPMPLIIVPDNSYMSKKTIDMVVLKAMSADYQSREEGDITSMGSTDSLDADCSIPFFAHYFTLLDVYGRGYVRPCCVIVCCSDRLRASFLFDVGCNLVKEMLSPFLRNNMTIFHYELKSNLSLVSNMLKSKENGDGNNITELTIQELKHFQEEYTGLLEKMEQNSEDIDDFEIAEVLDEEFFFNSLDGNCIHRCLRSIYTIMKALKKDVALKMCWLAETLKKTMTPRLFSLHEFCDFEFSETITCNSAVSPLSKYNLRYFLSAVSSERNFRATNSLSSVCCCQKSTESNGRSSSTSVVEVDYLFPNLIDVQGFQCQYLSNICQQLTIPVVTKLLGSILQQCNLMVIIDDKHYSHLMMFLSLFIPKGDKLKYIPTRNNWPTLNQMGNCPVMQINNEIRNPIMPNNLKRFIAVYDAINNKYLCGPEYNKGHIVTFLDQFKTLNYNQCHTETIVNIMLLSYFDLVYQWISMLVKRDRRWVNKYIIDMGASPEDTVISERLAFFVLQKLVLYKQSEMGVDQNLFLTTPSLFNAQCIKFCSKDRL